MGLVKVLLISGEGVRVRVRVGGSICDASRNLEEMVCFKCLNVKEYEIPFLTAIVLTLIPNPIFPNLPYPYPYSLSLHPTP